MLTQDEYRSLDATELAGLVRDGELTATEAIEACISEIERLDPVLNAVTIRNFERARSDAARVAGSEPLAGVPFLAKDINVDLAGFPTTHACRFFAGSTASEADSLLVQRWRSAGLVIAGRTNTSEFATDFTCEPELYGPSRNPWDVNRTPGGSSGGAAAAVASGMVPAAHASDSGGSIRVPAACCGVFGFKPTSGLVATGAGCGPLVGGLNCDHAITWTVRDSAAILDAIAGPEIGLPAIRTDLEGSFAAMLARPPGCLRIGFCPESPSGLKPDQETRVRLEDATQLLLELGHAVLPWNWPVCPDPAEGALLFWASELAASIERRAEELGREPGRAELGSLVRWSLEHARSARSTDVVHARAAIRQIQVAMSEAMEGFDILLTPVLTEPPLETGMATRWLAEDVEAWMKRSLQFAPYTEMFNVTGQPAMSVPLFHRPGRLPHGMQFVGRPGRDGQLLRLARQLEETAPWRERKPSMRFETS